MGIEPRELLKLHRCAAQHETVAIVCVSFHRRLFPQRSVSFVIFEHGLICEREGVAVEAKVWLYGACGCRKDPDRPQPRNTREFAPTPKHHIKSAPRRRRFCLRRRYPAGEIFDTVFPTVRRLEPWKSPAGPGAALRQDLQQQNHSPDARPRPVQK